MVYQMLRPGLKYLKGKGELLFSTLGAFLVYHFQLCLNL
jgi:hypothetical protein